MGSVLTVGFFSGFVAEESDGFGSSTLISTLLVDGGKVSVKFNKKKLFGLFWEH